MDYTAIVRVLYLAGQHETDSFGKRVPLDSLTLGQVNERKEMMNHSSHIERLYGQAIADVWELATAVGYNLHQSIFDLGPLPVGIDWSAVFASRGGTAASPGANTGSTPTSQTPRGARMGTTLESGEATTEAPESLETVSVLSTLASSNCYSEGPSFAPILGTRLRRSSLYGTVLARAAHPPAPGGPGVRQPVSWPVLLPAMERTTPSPRPRELFPDSELLLSPTTRAAFEGASPWRTPQWGAGGSPAPCITCRNRPAVRFLNECAPCFVGHT